MGVEIIFQEFTEVVEQMFLEDVRYLPIKPVGIVVCYGTYRYSFAEAKSKRNDPIPHRLGLLLYGARDGHDAG